MARKLIANGADVNGDAITPLFLAAYACKPAIIDLLLAAKADKDKTSRLDKTDPNLPDILQGEWLPSHAFSGAMYSMPVLTHLHQAGFNLKSVGGNGKFTPLHLLCGSPHFRPDADALDRIFYAGETGLKDTINVALEPSGYTPLLLAASNNNSGVKLVQLLVKHGADANHVANDGHNLFTLYARTYKQPDL